MSFNILIVDDAAFIREALKQICEGAGHWVVGESKNGVEAVKMYQKYKPDVVLMDLVLPEKNGVEAIEEIRVNFPNAKIIACSSMDQEQLKTKAELAGAVAFLVKPFSRQQVISLIQSVGGRKELKGA
jgi:two-component system chemotaxis response regulator CheY